MKEDRVATNLDEIFEAVRRARKFVTNLSGDDFLANEMVQQAVTMSIMIIGEAVVRLQRDEPQFVARHASLPWQSMRNMRNRIAHGYFTLDVEAVWETVTTSMPELVERLIDICKQEGIPTYPAGG